MSRLRDQVVLVTGASKGIGRAIALGCASEGAHVIVNYNSDRAGAEAVAAEIAGLGRRALLVQADIGRVSQVERMFKRARKEFPRLDVLINNSGLTGWSELFATTEAKWDLVLNTNLKGTFFCALAAARWMRETKTAGSIVNVSTNCAQLGVKNLIAYATSKAGLHGMTKQLAIELAPLGIRVNTFAPGPVNVDRNLADDPNYRDVWGAMIPPRSYRRDRRDGRPGPLSGLRRFQLYDRPNLLRRRRLDRARHDPHRQHGESRQA